MKNEKKLSKRQLNKIETASPPPVEYDGRESEFLSMINVIQTDLENLKEHLSSGTLRSVIENSEASNVKLSILDAKINSLYDDLNILRMQYDEGYSLSTSRLEKTIETRINALKSEMFSFADNFDSLMASIEKYPVEKISATLDDHEERTNALEKITERHEQTNLNLDEKIEERKAHNAKFEENVADAFIAINDKVKTAFNGITNISLLDAKILELSEKLDKTILRESKKEKIIGGYDLLIKRIESLERTLKRSKALSLDEVSKSIARLEEGLSKNEDDGIMKRTAEALESRMEVLSESMKEQNTFFKNNILEIRREFINMFMSSSEDSSTSLMLEKIYNAITVMDDERREEISEIKREIENLKKNDLAMMLPSEGKDEEMDLEGTLSSLRGDLDSLTKIVDNKEITENEDALPSAVLSISDEIESLAKELLDGENDDDNQKD